MKKQATLERKIEKIKQDLMNLGDMRPGSLSVQTRKWGGEYGQLSYTHRGKGHTEYVPERRRVEIERQTANYKRFRKLTQEWVKLSMELCKNKEKNEDEN